MTEQQMTPEQRQNYKPTPDEIKASMELLETIPGAIGIVYRSQNKRLNELFKLAKAFVESPKDKARFEALKAFVEGAAKAKKGGKKK